ncbi:MAG: 30S ribosomal protein S16 [Candidatus Paceibacterota bacterium]
MLMMRLQRVGRKNDPSYRIVVVDKRTGPKSNKHVDHLGSYNPKLNHVQLDKDKAKDWLSKGVQPSDTMYNILVSQKVIDGKKKNVLPKKSPIIDEAKLKAEAEAKEKAEQEAKEKAEAEAKVEEEPKAEAEAEKSEEAPAETEATEEAKEIEKATA